MTKKIAIQGAQASFHDIAARRLFGNDIDIVSCDTFAQTFRVLKDGQADGAVCAIENSLHGSINEVYDLLLKYHFPIVGEVYLRIDQCLVGLPGAFIGNIAEVYSHPVALAQCESYLDTKMPGVRRFEAHDTAGSVAFVKERNDPRLAAIAGKAAAELHGMAILAENIETNPQNYTRFVVLGKHGQTAPNKTKTSLVLQTNHRPAALYTALGAFAKRSLNLTKLQSRPIIGNAWKYLFYVDIEAADTDKLFLAALDDLRSQDCQVTILGSYGTAPKAQE